MLEVRLWDRFFDNYVQGPTQQIVADRLRGAKGDLSKERSTLASAYRLIDRQMAPRSWISNQGSRAAALTLRRSPVRCGVKLHILGGQQR